MFLINQSINNWNKLLFTWGITVLVRCSRSLSFFTSNSWNSSFLLGSNTKRRGILLPGVSVLFPLKEILISGNFWHSNIFCRTNTSSRSEITFWRYWHFACFREPTFFFDIQKPFHSGAAWLYKIKVAFPQEDNLSWVIVVFWNKWNIIRRLINCGSSSCAYPYFIQPLAVVFQPKHQNLWENTRNCKQISTGHWFFDWFLS